MINVEGNSDSEDFNEENLAAGFDEAIDALGRVNIMVLGKTGVGKTTIVNTLFGEEAATSVGRPCTSEKYLYRHDAGQVGILDTRGLEINENVDQFFSDVEKEIRKRDGQGIFEQIHVVWYCVLGLSAKLEESEEEIIRRLHALGLPVILVLTKESVHEGRPQSFEFIRWIEEQKLPIQGGSPIPIRAMPFAGEGVFGLDALLLATKKSTPEGVERALDAAQIIDFKLKDDQANKVILAAAASAATAGAIPLPGADIVPITAIQIAMIGKLSLIYNVPRTTHVKAAKYAVPAAGVVGRVLFRQGIKFIPIAGDVIAAGVAGGVTVTMGKAWMALCQAHAKGDLDLGSMSQGEIVALATKLIKQASKIWKSKPDSADQIIRESSTSRATKEAAAKKTAKKSTAKKAAKKRPAKKAAAKKTAKKAAKRPAKKTAKKAAKRPAKKAAAKKTAKKSTAKKTAKKSAAKKATKKTAAKRPAKKATKKTAAKRPAKKATAKRTTKKAAKRPAKKAAKRR